MKKNRMNKLLGVLLGITMVMGAIGCGKTTTISDETTPQGSTATDGMVVYRSALTEELNSLDPTYNQYATSLVMISSVNEGLYKYGPDGSIVLGMAESVDVSDDNLTYIFHIREDAYWSNGDPVKANDWEYSWKRMANPENGSPQAFFLVTAGIKNAYEVCYGGADVESLGVKALDDKTLQIEVTAPRAYFTYLLCNTTCLMPINQAFCEASGDQFMLDKEHTISCGAYVITEWEVGGTRYVLDKNPTYYDADSVTCDRIEYTLLTDKQQQVLGWESGELDQLTLTGDYIAMYQGDPAMQVLGNSGVFFIAFNTEDEYLSNQNLRLAISSAINKQTIVDNILCDGSVVADYAVPASFAPNSKNVNFRDAIGNPTYNSYDVAVAQEYWENAKKELGTDTVTLEFLYNEDSTLATVAAFVQAEIQENLPGVTVDLRCVSYNQRLEDMSAGNYDFGLTRWYADYQDPLTFLDMWIASSSLNYENWMNAEYEDLYTKVTGEYATDEENRLAAYARMEEIILSEAAICPLYQPSTVYLRSTKMNFVYTALGGVVTKYTTYK